MIGYTVAFLMPGIKRLKGAEAEYSAGKSRCLPASLSLSLSLRRPRARGGLIRLTPRSTGTTGQKPSLATDEVNPLFTFAPSGGAELTRSHVRSIGDQAMGIPSPRTTRVRRDRVRARSCRTRELLNVRDPGPLASPETAVTLYPLSLYVSSCVMEFPVCTPSVRSTGSIRSNRSCGVRRARSIASPARGPCRLPSLTTTTTKNGPT